MHVRAALFLPALQGDLPIRSLLAEETEVDFEYSLEETHVGTLVETNLVFPQVDYKHF